MRTWTMWALAGCAGTTETAEQSCAELESAAGDAVQAVIDAHQACTVDEDCVVVALAGACFDRCERVVGTGGEAAVADAIADAEGTFCAQQADTCTLEIPPCTGPDASRISCSGGVCVEDTSP